jgi:hypothetical protein
VRRLEERTERRRRPHRPRPDEEPAAKHEHRDDKTYRVHVDQRREEYRRGRIRGL